MFYKSNFQKVKDFWNNWWSSSKAPPAILKLTPKPGVSKIHMPNPVFIDNVDILIEELSAWVESYEFSENFVPGCVVSFGADHFAALLGGELHVDKESMTTWIEPSITKWADADIKVRWDSKIGSKTIEYIRRLKKEFDGKIVISATHLQGGLDCLAAMRSPFELLYDLVDDSKGVKKALNDVDKCFTEVVQVLSQELDTKNIGSINRHGLYCPGFAGLLQCDFSCMINSEMFKEFALPSLIHEAETVDYAEYHLDGENAIHHLDDICSIDKIKIVQWQPGVTGLDKDWKALHKRIDDLGRGQYFFHPDKLMRQWIEDELSCSNHCFDLIGLDNDVEN